MAQANLLGEDTGDRYRDFPQPQGPMQPVSAAFDPSRAPGGDVPMEWAEDFIRRNPGDYHRISEAYESDRKNKQAVNIPPLQFDDAYSNQLESLARAQMGQVRSNPGLDSLMQFLTQQFQDLSTNPGYNQGEQAMLRTQALEPIEANRQASMQRARERASVRNFLPSSGLHELDLRDIERAADQARTVAGRDLAIAGLDRRDRDLSRALDLGQLLGLSIPRQQRSEELGLANLLYQMPRTALDDALRVISGTPSSTDAFSQALQLLQQQYQQQGRADQNNAALYGQIGQILAQLFR